MKEIMKLIQFDFITSMNGALPFFGGMLVISILMTVFGMFHMVFSVFLILSSAMVFGPAQQLSQSAENRRIYGILPVGRKSVIRADFAESSVPLFVGLVLSLVFSFLSSFSKLYRILPEKLSYLGESLVENKKIDTATGFIWVRDVFILATVYIVIAISVLKMRSFIENHEHDIRNTLIFFTVTVAGLIGSIYLSLEKEIIPPYDKWLFPSTVAGEWIWGICLCLGAAAVCAVCCRIAELRTADQEI